MSFVLVTVPIALIIANALKKPDMDRNYLRNYRPVSNLLFLSKVYGMCRRTEHLLDNQVLDPRHSISLL